MSTPDKTGPETICTDCEDLTPFYDDDMQPYCEECWEALDA